MRFRLSTAGDLAFRQSVRAVLRHKLRSFLATLGIAIAIASVIWVVAIGRSGAARAQEQLHALGDNLVWVEAGSRNVAGLRTGTHGAASLMIEDAEAIVRDVPEIRTASPQIDGSVLVVRGHTNWTTRYRGVTPEYLPIKRWEVREGEVFTEAHVALGANVCLLGQTVRQRLFGTESPVGQTIRIGTQPFEVVGVLGAKGQSATGQDQDDTIFVPYTTAQTKIRGASIRWLDDIVCSAVSADAVPKAAARIVVLMRERHRIPEGGDDDFNIRHPEDLIQAELETSRTFATLLVSIASVALLVGGIGVMNVMLASVTERTSEIGVRLAVGAPRWAVQLQFLAEAAVLTTFGGAVGVGASVVGSFTLGHAIGWTLAIPADAVVLTLGFAASVGLFFGFYPAWKAARMDPIEALRQS